MKKIINIETINIIGKKESNKKVCKVNYYLFGEFIIKKRKNM